ncbi:prolipoprotein diacylglyceryl transferase [Terriglobus saanensis]|uniref:Prolipoprotein diacylglyceryl transferase n=1 Tax=Terriglobus saanensis (strain ATCC BAA-1853 / DSM 23119 / SP1PR4) TaxID=401053 RepID=E8V277_TERSS|nr:prolipoprotein diacylglyceryl transferase family protein [Terriglobus saanensis]ADV81210.1 prolipoprotein diacylglyceryl transferase [Terriglobus saanensis SP1PR4]
MHPHLFHLGPVTLQTYGAVAALGLVLAMVLAARNARVTGLEEDAVWSACLVAIVGTLVVSRIVLVSENLRAFRLYPLLILTLPTVTRFGLAVSVLSGVAYAMYRRLPLRILGDAVAPAAMLLASFLHFGDLMAGNDVGSATTGVFGRLVPSMHSANGIGSHPVALYSAVAHLLIAALGVWYLPRRRHAGEVLGGTVMLAAAARFLIDCLRPAPIEVGTVFAGLRFDQYLLLCIVVSGGALLLQSKEHQRAI